jgi:AcrR family transcriptional regulator
MEDIARAMGKGKSTLYYYYKSKEDIFDAVVRTEMNEVFQVTSRAVDQAHSASDKLKAFFAVSFQQSKTKVNLYKVMREEMGSEDLSHVHHIVKELNGKMIFVIEGIFQEGFDSGEFCSELSDQLDLISYSIVSSMRSLVFDLALESKIPDWDQRLNFFVDLLIKALHA